MLPDQPFPLPRGGRLPLLLPGRAEPPPEDPEVGRLTVGRLAPAEGRETEPPVEGRMLEPVRGALDVLLPRAEVRLPLEDPLPTARATEPRPRAMRSIRLPSGLPEAEDPPLLAAPPKSAPIRWPILVVGRLAGVYSPGRPTCTRAEGAVGAGLALPVVGIRVAILVPASTFPCSGAGAVGVRSR